MQVIDTHAHIHFDVYDGQTDAVIARAAEAGVDRMVVVGVTAEDSRNAVALALQHDGLMAAVGVHPNEAATEGAEASLEAIGELATMEPVVAIGEVGLDLYRSDNLAQQEKLLRSQIGLAMDLELPLIYHVRDAFDDFFRILSDYPRWPGVVHSFTGTVDDLQRVLDAGLYVGVNGIATFTKSEAQLEAFKQIPLDRLLLETDCPFLTPAPNRGKQNEPANIVDALHFLAELRGEDPAVLAEATTSNAERLLDL